MFIINCPFCGERDQTEFVCHGEAHIARPENPEDISDEEWGDYLFFRINIYQIKSFSLWENNISIALKRS